MCEQTSRDKLVEKVVERFMRELVDRHPGVTIEVMGKQPGSTADSWIRVISPSRETSLEIAETEAHLVTGYVMDEGVDIICLGELSEDVWLAEELSP